MVIETRKAHQNTQDIYQTPPSPARWRTFRQQVVRFGLVGGINTALDLLALNALLLLLPTNQTWLVLLYTVLAYSFGAFNSFLLNKYWTFQNRQRMSWPEFVRFVCTTLLGMAMNTAFIWVIGMLPHPFMRNTILWTNCSKIAAIAASAFISYLGMRFWVFMKKP